MATLTTTYSFSMPLVGGDADVWGGMLNDNWDDLDDRLTATFDTPGAGHLGTLKPTKMPPLLNDTTLVSTSDNTSVGPTLTLYRNSPGPADNDPLGILVYSGENDIGDTVNYARIFARISDVTDGTENGELTFQIIANGTITTSLTLSSTGAAFTGQLAGDGSGLTGVTVTGSNVVSGTIPNARINGDYTGFEDIVGTGNANFNAFRVQQGADVQLFAEGDNNTGVRFPAGLPGVVYLVSNGVEALRINGSTVAVLNSNVFSGNGSGLTNLDATALTGTILVARLPTGSGAEDWTLANIAGASTGVVGTYAMLRQNSGSNSAPGDTKAGSTLKYANAGGAESGSAVSGTWKCMGRTVTTGSSEERTTLWLRIS